MKPNRLAGLALLAAAISCSDATAPLPQMAELQAARLRWRAQNLHDYAVVVQHSCFCGYVSPLYTVVLDDTVAGVVDLQSGASIDPRVCESVDDLFAVIESAIQRHAEVIRAEFDPEKGFPTAIELDGAARIADDEIFYRITDVHPITRPTAGLTGR
jgi:hypothetical protein